VGLLPKTLIIYNIIILLYWLADLEFYRMHNY
jgi:hypothetical protein